MNHIYLLGAALAVSLAPTPAIAQTDSGQSPSNSAEIGYAKDALGFNAMVDRDYQTAVAQMENNTAVDSDDPARLINLGQAYAELGETAKAQQLLLAAANSPKSFDLVLSDGNVANSRDVAKLALNRINARLASR